MRSDKISSEVKITRISANVFPSSIRTDEIISVEIFSLGVSIFGSISYRMLIIDKAHLHSILYYHLIAADAQVKPAPKAASIIISPVDIFFISTTSAKAMGIEAAVVLPYL